jgi:hypothetical protein
MEDVSDVMYTDTTPRRVVAFHTFIFSNYYRCGRVRVLSMCQCFILSTMNDNPKLHIYIYNSPQCLPMVRIDMDRGEVNIRGLGVPNKIRSKQRRPPFWWIDSQPFWVIRTIKTFESNSNQMFLVDRFDKS